MSKNFQKWRTYYLSGLLSKKKLARLIGNELGLTQEEYDALVKEKAEDEADDKQQ